LIGKGGQGSVYKCSIEGLPGEFVDKYSIFYDNEELGE